MSMKSRTVAVLGAALMVSAMSALAEDTRAEDEKQPKACCMSACAKHAGGKMRCSMTGKTVETCCCIEKEGRLHCTLAGKDVESCCCTPAADDADTTDDTTHDHGHDHTGEPQQ
jgi:hypothetical protein